MSTATHVNTPVIQYAGVVGTGTMGQGIAQLLAQGGIEVRIFDHNPQATERALHSISSAWSKQVAKGRMTPEACSASIARLQGVTQLQDLAGCDLVVEAIAEDLAIKQALFAALESILRNDAILATNTSSLSVTAVAAQCAHPARVAGWHFFNPVPLMRIAEVVRGERTDAQVVATLSQLTTSVGHHAVQAVDLPGFVVNHAGRAFIPEGLRLLSEGVATADEIDAVMRDVAGFRMGPFELLDLVGLDVGQQVMESLYHQYYEEPRFRITPLVARKVAAGQLGRKCGEGFYRYLDGAIQRAPEVAPEAADIGTWTYPVWLHTQEADLAARVRQHLAGVAGVVWETGAEPSAEALIITTPVGHDTASTCLHAGLDHTRVVAVDAVLAIDQRCALMAAPGLHSAYREQATRLFHATGAAVTWLHDSPGFIAQRVIAQIVNIGADMAQHRVASPEDIDTAVQLALGYPLGPFALVERIGVSRVLQISLALQSAYGDPRYRPSIWLRRRAQLKLPLNTPD